MCLLKAILHFKSNLNDLTKDLIIYPQLLVNQKVKDKNTVLNDTEITSKIESIKKELNDEGQILVRPSGTEPLIRVMVEAKSDELCNKYVYEIIDMIKQKGYDD